MNTFKRSGRVAFLAGIVLIVALLPGVLCVLFAPGVDERVAAAREAAALESYVVRMVDTGAIRLIANTSVAAPSRLFAQFPVPAFAATAMPSIPSTAHRAYESARASNASNAANTSDATFAERLRALPWTWLLAGVAGGLTLSAWLGLLMVRRLSPVGQLSDAVRRHQFIVAYQPIVDLTTRRCIGAEALVRWKHQDRIVRPDHFIPLAEHRGLIQAITDQVFDTVLLELGEFLQRYSELYVSINLSAPDLTSRRFLERLTPALAAANISPRQIRIEATERCFLDADAAKEVIQAFRDAGHPVYIDDFGTGYSSLSHLQNFQVDALKIDKSFVDTVDQDSASSSVASHIIDMALTLHVQVVAEGIEREEQACYLRTRGAQFGQGWLFSAPLTAPDFIRYVGRGLVTV
ncbi:EAL domain-containing protein [Burkholderia sp. S171]|uniref:EAL domain-containing protein n=1 Tax=Burkholderia sp. S171 TaxID=1641860 RepID=UPI0020B17112|nr:EAL domain-containing protein [Burkholderia sp. S171]